MFKPRPNQLEIIRFEKGRMGITAVPGSGKTHTLSYLAAKLIAKGLVKDDQEVLIVTLVNSSVDNFAQRIAGFITKEFNLLANMNYRVRTLHGLAYDIVKERPQLANLADQFEIADERETNEIISRITNAWLHSNSDFIDRFRNQTIENQSSRKLRMGWENLLIDIASSFIKQAKDLDLGPEKLKQILDHQQIKDPLMQMGYEVYLEYQRALSYRGAVDFEDLILLAFKILNGDQDYLSRLQSRWPYILEDEAQDSSLLQEKILRLLAGKKCSWVRVGDPNQAIYETFTTANPRFLRNFLEEEGVISYSLPNSGRSTNSIINLANYLIRWTNIAHPVLSIRNTLLSSEIKPTPPGDPQPNPPDNPDSIHLVKNQYEPAKEIQIVSQSIKKWIIEHKNETIAVLVPRNDRGAEMVEALKAAQIDCIELLQSSRSTRQAAKILANLMRFIDDPITPTNLAELFKSIYLQEQEYNNPPDKKALIFIIDKIKKLKSIEELLSPQLSSEKWAESKAIPLPGWSKNLLEEFKRRIENWQKAALLPIDQFILTVSTELFKESTDLAITYRLALLLKRAKKMHPMWNFSEYAQELQAIADNRIKLVGFSAEDLGFDPDEYKGKVVVATIHKAKGLEWDRVYILSVNNYDFPSAQEMDEFIAERWFVRDQLNLQAETIAKLKTLVNIKNSNKKTKEGEATHEARLSYCAERLRLLYVGITRARKDLIITWNTGRRGQCKPAMPLAALIDYWEKTHGTAV